MTFTNLFATRCYYDRNKTNLPIVLLGEGWDSPMVDDETLAYFAGTYDLFAVTCGMRGRAGASGARDASGREIHDLYDAILQIRADFASVVSPDKACIIGASGSGGNALACACKFPDLFSVVVDAYGMSDYGRDATFGWYQQVAGYRDAIAMAVGGTPTDVPNNYYARDATAAIANFTGGKLHLFHDQEDTVVPYSHSTRIVDAMDAALLTNYETHFTNVGDNPRYTHLGLLRNLTDALYMDDILNQPAWTIPASGTVTVIGYIVTKRFTIWLDQGLTAAATVVYDTATGTYLVTPLTTAAMTVTITQGAKSGSAAAITETTQIVVV